MAEKTRVHTLAKALNVTSKDIIAKCQAEGITVKNHMSTLGPGLEATIREWFSEGVHDTTVETAGRVNLQKVRKKPKAKKKAKTKKAKAVGKTKKVKRAVAKKKAEPTTVETEAGPEGPPLETPEAPATLVATVEPEVAPAAEVLVADAGTAAEVTLERRPPSEAPAEAVPGEAVPALGEPAGPAEPLAGPAAAEVAAKVPEPPPPEPAKPAGPQNVPLPAKVSGPRVVRYEAPEEYTVPKRGPRRRAIAAGGEKAGDQGLPTMPEALEMPPGQGRDRRRRGGTAEDKPSAQRTSVRRIARSMAEASEQLGEWNDQDLAERRERLREATGRRISSRRAASRKGTAAAAVPAAPITHAQVEEPIVVKQLCAAIGISFQRLVPVLHREFNLHLGLTSIIPKDVAELVAVSFGVELTVVEAKTGLDRIKEDYQALERDNLVHRPPIVTMLGHVDHGKTSLLDRIRRARVVDREDGGITQHISSYHFRKNDVAVTFLDTPGHEAFTALRARGAQLTDVVVLVIAADDGVMPQTVEAINHAKAAAVPIVVALNKIDLGTQNVTKIYAQLAERGLTPGGDWGGDTDVIHTSALTGEGIEDLLEHLSTLAELHEYQADPTIPPTGVVVEAESRQGVGPVLQVIVREGTVRVGDILVCGNSFGKVRAIRNDTGEGIEEAGPSMPAEIWGMNEVANAGDHFYRVERMQRAKEIAEEIKQRRQTDALSSVQKARSLDDLLKHRTDADVGELNVIIKADVDGSVDVLNQTLTQFPSEEVKLNVLHHGVGAVTDSDVHLADASNAIIVAFRVTAPGKTRKLAEEKGVAIRRYKVIYDVTDDIKKALEGLLTPDEVVEMRGAAEVREVFRITKVGLVAGGYVRDGVVAVSHLARVVRDGVVVRDNCQFESLRRFKEDVKEVRSGMECGMRLERFDDVKVGDVIETFEIVKVARTLD